MTLVTKVKKQWSLNLATFVSKLVFKRSMWKGLRGIKVRRLGFCCCCFKKEPTRARFWSVPQTNHTANSQMYPLVLLLCYKPQLSDWSTFKPWEYRQHVAHLQHSRLLAFYKTHLMHTGHTCDFLPYERYICHLFWTCNQNWQMNREIQDFKHTLGLVRKLSGHRKIPYSGLTWYRQEMHYQVCIRLC